MSSYATLAQAEADLKFDGLTTTALEVVSGKAYLIQALEFVSARIDQICGQGFAPFIETRPYDVTQRYIDRWRNQLILDRPLLEAIEVHVAGTLLTQWDGLIYADRPNYDYMTYPHGATPATALQGLQNNLAWIPLLNYGWSISAAMSAISVNAIWGFRTRYTEEGWLTSGATVQDNPLSSSATTITVSSAAPFSPGQLLRIGTEYISVSAVTDNTSPTPDTLTVQRGVRGSTAAAHSQNAAIEIFQPEPNIVRATLRWANYLYQRRAVYEAVTINANNTYASVFPQDAPEEVWNILEQYINIQSAKV